MSTTTATVNRRTVARRHTTAENKASFAMSLSRPIGNKEQCIEALLDAVGPNDVSILIFRLIAAFVPYGEFSRDFGTKERICGSPRFGCVIVVDSLLVTPVLHAQLFDLAVAARGPDALGGEWRRKMCDFAFCSRHGMARVCWLCSPLSRLAGRLLAERLPSAVRRPRRTNGYRCACFRGRNK